MMTKFYAIELHDQGHRIVLAYYQNHARALRGLKKYGSDQPVVLIHCRFRDDGPDDV
jgi:hypothetical protein